MEESEPAFNQFVTLEQNQSKKKKNNNKKASYFNQISPPFKQQNDQRSRWRSISISISEKRTDLAPSFDQRKTARGRFRFLKDLRLPRLRCAIVVSLLYIRDFSR